MQGERQVEFNRGKVAYKGQSEIYCNYAKVVNPNGTEIYYYFLNDLDNGYYIASTDLKEAIDPDIPKSSLGLLDKKGDIIIPFENKLLKVVDDKYLLVVRSEAKTQSVLDAIASRNDPTAAERMVNANATIKDKLNKTMGTQDGGKFILNDLLSEGTVYTLDGKNLFDNQYFSFIGMTDDSFYCSTNVPGERVNEFPFNAPVKSVNLLQDPPIVEPDKVLPVVDSSLTTLDVSSAQVPKDVIDSALESSSDNKMRDVSASDVNKKVSSDDIQSTFDKPLNEVKLDSIFSQPVVANNHSSAVNETLIDSKDSIESSSEVNLDSTNLDGSSFEDTSEKEENFSDVVSAVGGLVQENQKQKQELKKKDLNIMSLQERIQTMQKQEQTADHLAAENARLKKENEHLKQRIYQLVEGYNQMREALSAPAAYGDLDSQSYKKVA